VESIAKAPSRVVAGEIFPLPAALCVGCALMIVVCVVWLSVMYVLMHVDTRVCACVHVDIHIHIYVCMCVSALL
jgi:hypothetical protein